MMMLKAEISQFYTGKEANAIEKMENVLGFENWLNDDEVVNYLMKKKPSDRK